jgi:tRNA-modifying protein YgfZ
MPAVHAPPFPPVPTAAVRADLTALAMLELAGADAGDFLHGQLSSNVKALAVDAAHYASYNSPKGRMLATLIVWRRAGDRYALVLALDLADMVRRRLAMFVMRAKVSVAVVARPLRGVLGAHAAQAVATALAPSLHVAASPAPADAWPAWTSRSADGASLLRLPDGRWLVDAGDALPAAIAALPVVEEDVWRWCGICAGVPVVTAATSDQLIAQQANWELLGGVDFRKGCYPGQEIIARMQYLGRLKERLHGFHIDSADVADGTPLAAGDGAASAGIVVNAAPSPVGGSDVLAVVRNDVAGASGFAIGGVALSPRALPYVVPVLDNVRVKL